MSKKYFVYILTNVGNTVFYTGVTNDLARRIWEHKNGTSQTSFTSKYKVNRLVYFEVGDSAEGAIAREKQTKGGSRQKKVDFIKLFNPDWNDLGEDI